MPSSSSPASTSGRRPEPPAGLGLALVLALVAGCDAPEAPAVPPETREPVAPEDLAPAGTAVLVDHVPIPADEVERWAEWIAEVEPQYVPEARRRYALTNGLLERAALTALHGEARARALEDALACADRLAAGEPPPEGVFSDELEGAWGDLGLQLWGELQPVEPGRWVGPFERLGTFTLARVRSTRVERGLEVLEVELLEYPYLTPDTAPDELRTCVDRVELTIVDPSYRTLVPEAWKFRMRGTDR